MDATIVVHVQPREAVPDGAERVAWLERYGVPPAQAEVSVTLPLAEWARLRAPIQEDGTIDVGPGYRGWLSSTGSDGEQHHVIRGLRREILRQIRETGAGLIDLAATDSIRAITEAQVAWAIDPDYGTGQRGAYLQHERWLAARAAASLAATERTEDRARLDTEGPACLIRRRDISAGEWITIAIGSPTDLAPRPYRHATSAEVAAAVSLAAERNQFPIRFD